MIERIISQQLLQLIQYYPIISLNGPRQSGKTTLLKKLFSELPYLSLEDPDIRMAAQTDPRGFLLSYPSGAVFDEVQRVPELFSYLQTVVDGNKTIKFVLSGSQNFLLNEKITQSLAGRVGKATLLPFSQIELAQNKLLNNDFKQQAYRGNYPALYDKNIPPALFYSNYLETYVERDVRLLKNIGDLSQFTKFVHFLAGNCGGILNLSEIANAIGIAVNTAKSWVSILEASYIIFLLSPHYVNFNKRLVKSPKIYFYDTGLLCYLLKLNEASQIENHYLKGGIFENFVIAELLKKEYNELKLPDLYFWRDQKGIEIDCIVTQAGRQIPIEIKSSSTYHPDFIKNMKYWMNLEGNTNKRGYLIYNGTLAFKQNEIDIIHWKDMNIVFN